MTQEISALRSVLLETQHQLPQVLEACLAREPLLPGSLCTLRRECGQSHCHCSRGELHESIVLCYKAVLLLHCDAAGERFVVAGVRVLREKESEATALWPLRDAFLNAVGSGVMKVLLIDRGFITGAEIGRQKRDHGIDTVVPIRSDTNLQEDVLGLMNLPTTWEVYEPKPHPRCGIQPEHRMASHLTSRRRIGNRRGSRRWPASARTVSRSHGRTRAAFGNNR